MIRIYDQANGNTLHSISCVMNYNIADPVSGTKCFTAQGQHSVIHFHITPKQGKHYGIGSAHRRLYVEVDDLQRELRENQ